MNVPNGELGGAGTHFNRVEFETPLDVPPEDEVEFSLDDGDVGSERKTVQTPTEGPVPINPGPGTSNTRDVRNVDLWIRAAGGAPWYRYRFEAEEIITDLRWTQMTRVGQHPEVPPRVEASNGGTPVPGSISYVGESQHAPPPG